MDPTFSSSSSIARRTLYSTPLVHSVSRDELEILPRALVCVDSSGIIEWIEKDCPGGRVQEVRCGMVSYLETRALDQAGAAVVST